MPGSIPEDHARGRGWAMLGILLSLASILLAAIDLLMQILRASAAGLEQGHLIFALVVCLVGMVLFIAWLGRLLAKPYSWPQQVDQRADVPIVLAQQTAFAHVTGDAWDSGKYGQPVPLYNGQQEQEISIRRAALSVSITQDPLFSFDAPTAGERCFVLPKEGEPLMECQDRYALNAAQRCYAVADGVSGSFLPGPWASIIARRFVDDAGVFRDKDAFQHWLSDCSVGWHTWMENRWVPTMNWQRQLQGERPGDWSEEILHGAQTTLAGCAIGPQNNLGLIDISVCAIGDSQFFLFRPSRGGSWTMQAAFPLTHPGQFGFKPDTLSTVSQARLLEQAWMARKTMACSARPGDYAVLATDALGKWLLAQARRHPERIHALLTTTDAHEFRRIVHEELRAKRIEEDDDMTLLVIPL